MFMSKAKVRDHIDSKIKIWKRMLDEGWPEVPRDSPTYELVMKERLDLEARISALTVLKHNLGL